MIPVSIAQLKLMQAVKYTKKQTTALTTMTGLATFSSPYCPLTAVHTT
jgi:hypothetical protein